MKQYMLMMKGSLNEWNEQSPTEKQKVMEKYFAFVKVLKANHGFQGGSALDERTMHLRSENGKIICDGPFSESKEALTGYMIFEANDLQEAAQIAKDCPALTHGETVEVAELVNHG